MPRARHRPLLREIAGPRTVPGEHPCEDVLDDARFLIERFFDEERVIDDLPLASRIRRRRLRFDLRAARQEKQREDDSEAVQLSTTSTSSFDAARAPIVIGRSFWRRTTASAASSRDVTSIRSPGFKPFPSMKRRNAGS